MYTKLLHDLIQNHEEILQKRIAIYPFGANGLETKKILNWAYGVQEEFIIDNVLARYNRDIITVEELAKQDTEGLVVILTVMDAVLNKSLENTLCNCGKEIEIKNILEPIEEFYRKIHDLTRVKIVKDKKLIRVGAEHDGGYIMADDFDKNMKAYSFGIGDNVSWDQAIADRNMDVYMYDPTIEKLPEDNQRFHFLKKGIAGWNSSDELYQRIETILDANDDIDNKNLILKMDVEGAEWDFILNTDSVVLKNFRQMTFELHGLTHYESRSRIIEALAKLNETHQAVWVHANNCGSVKQINDIIVPNLLEITYLRRDCYSFEDNDIMFPLEIDSPNVLTKVGYEEIILGRWNLA